MSSHVTEKEYRKLVGIGRKLQQKRIVPPAPLTTSMDGAKRLLQVLLAAGIPGPWYREFTFHQDRDWRLDVANPERKVCIEVDGMVHRIKRRFLSDMEKHNALIITGWRYLRVTPRQVENGEAVVLVKALLFGEDT